MERKTFSAAVKMGSPLVPQPLSTPSHWESYLLQELKKVQNELALLKASIAVKDEKIIQLEAQLQISQEHTTQEENNQAQQQVTNQLVHKVIAEIKEKEQIQDNKKIIRIGGLRDDWSQVAIEEDDEYMTDTNIWKLKLQKAVPFVDLGDPIYIKIKGKQAVATYDTMEEKIKVMKQTKSLQGTKVWISDELTPLQLKERANELAKVHKARKEGKWTVNRGGKALIREFKNPIPPK